MTTFLRRILFIGILAVIWEVTSRLSSLPDFMFPSLTKYLQTLFTGISDWTNHVCDFKSMSRLLNGFSIATVLGVFLGYLIWRSKLLKIHLDFSSPLYNRFQVLSGFPLRLFGLV